MSLQSRGLEVFGIRLVGLDADTGRKVVLTLITLVALHLIGRALRAALRAMFGRRTDVRTRFWTGQAVSIVVTALSIILIVSIWFDDPGRLAGAFGLVSAGLAFALQRVITAVAGYFVILRGRIFSVGDRVTIGGVRGDVIALGYTRTTVMEMGQPPSEQDAPPAMWVKARQYTGRIVTVTNDKVFDEPVYNYSRGFPYLWEEMHLPIEFSADHGRVEQILLDSARRHAAKAEDMEEDVLREMERRFFLKRSELAPRVYWRITDSWLEMSVRFIVHEHGIRELKDAMSREILAALNEAGIAIASTTFAVTGLPPVHLLRDPRRADPRPAKT